MPSSSRSSLTSLLIAAAVLAAISAMIVGTILLASGAQQPILASSLVVFGSLALCLYPAGWSLSAFSSTGLLGVGLCVAGAGATMGWMFSRHAELSPLAALGAWGFALALLLLAALVQDLQQGWRMWFERADWGIAGAFLLLALLARCLGHPSLAVDEHEHFKEIMSGYPNLPGSPWSLTSLRVPLFIDDAIFAVAVLLRGVFDPLDTAKFVTVLAASLSVAAWYLVVRVFASRCVAASAAILLLFLGLHWVNSRFLYLYPFDFASVSIGTLCLVLALERRLLFPAVLAGATLAFALAARRIGFMMVPLFAYTCLDYFAGAPRGQRRTLLWVMLTTATTTAFSYAPMFLDEVSIRNFGRIFDALDAQQKTLAAFGMATKSEAVVAILGDAWGQFFIQGHDIPRHLLRQTGALLDPIFALLFAIGAVGSLLSIRTQRCSRLQLVGLLLCTLAMALSFPLDSTGPHGLARRMSCASFFLAWIAATGAFMLSARVMRGSAVAAVCIGLSVTSLLMNAYYLKTHYLRPPSDRWHYDYGGSRAALLSFVRKAALQGARVVVLNHPFLGAQQAHFDLPLVSEANSIDEVRDQLAVPFQGTRIVVIPSAVVTGFSPDVYNQLSGESPALFWSDGPPDPQGIPQFRYAVLRRNDIQQAS